MESYSVYIPYKTRRTVLLPNVKCHFVFRDRCSFCSRSAEWHNNVSYKYKLKKRNWLNSYNFLFLSISTATFATVSHRLNACPSFWRHNISISVTLTIVTSYDSIWTESCLTHFRLYTLLREKLLGLRHFFAILHRFISCHMVCYS